MYSVLKTVPEYRYPLYPEIPNLGFCLRLSTAEIRIPDLLIHPALVKNHHTAVLSMAPWSAGTCSRVERQRQVVIGGEGGVGRGELVAWPRPAACRAPAPPRAAEK